VFFSTDPGERREFISALRELAAFLEENPDVPVPLHRVPICLSATGTDAEMFAAIDRIAAMLGVPAIRGGHYTATRRFGQIEYRAVAIPAAWDAEYEARHSYDGNITLTDTGQSAPAA
jgi:hypothetical protein